MRADVALRDGSPVQVRPASSADVEPLAAFLQALSPDAVWFRFLGGVDAERAGRRLAEDGVGLVATAGPEGEIVAHACYVPYAPGQAEVAFTVAGAWEGHGIATLLLVELADLADQAGIDTLTALVHPANHGMLQVFRDSGFPLEVASEPGELHLRMPAHLGPDAIAHFEQRDAVAAVAAVRHVLEPASIAVVGASRDPDSVGGALLRNLLASSFAGDVYPVNRHAREIAGVAAYASLADVPGSIELAVIAVPAKGVLGVARECAARGVRALVVLTAGFGETGAEGRALQDDLLRICRDGGMRLVGPNCLGVLNTDAAVRMDATFAPGTPPAGTVAFASQSGAYGIAALDQAARRGLGLSSFVSLGDKADLSGNDFLRYWEQDDRTDVVLLYLESLGNPRRFAQIARRLTKSKPVVAVKSGRTLAGRRASSSHTGALLEASETTVDALFDHAGVIRVDTLDEQLDVAAMLALAPLPRGNRVAIVTNAGGPAITCADACAAAGLRVEPLAERTQLRLGRHLPAASAVANPVDMLAAATPADFRRTIERVAADPGVDAVIAIFIAPLPGRRSEPVLEAIRTAADVAAHHGVAVAAVIMAPERLGASGLPVYASPEHAARALGHAVRHVARVTASVDEPQTPTGVDADSAAAVLAAALASGPGWLGADATARLLRAYGIPVVQSEIAGTPADAAAAATRLDGPGVEMLVGVLSDPEFGPVVACAAGGTAVELLGDVQVRLAPVAAGEAASMVRALRTFPLLDGYRGAPVADVGALEDILIRVAALAAAHPEIAELDLNPVVVSAAGAVIVDARVRVQRPPRRPLRGAL